VQGHRGPENVCRACIFNMYSETGVLITKLDGKPKSISSLESHPVAELWTGQAFISCQ